MVAEALGDLVASQHGAEQANFFLPCRVEAGVAVSLLASSLRQVVQVVQGRRGSSTTAKASR